MQVVQEFLHMVTFVYQDWLLILFDQEFMLVVFGAGVCHIAEIFIAKESMQEYIIKLDKQS